MQAVRIAAEGKDRRIEMLQTIRKKRFARILIVGILTICLVIPMMQPATITADAATPFTATGKIKPKKGTYLRATASNSGKKLKKLKKNTRITITEEVFQNTSTKAKKKWYAVKAGGKSGYIRSDYVKSVSYTKTSRVTTAKLNFRNGPSVKNKKKGSFKKGTTVAAVLKARRKGTGDVWFKVKKGKKYYYVHSAYLADPASIKKTTPAPAPAPAPKPAPAPTPAPAPAPTPAPAATTPSNNTQSVSSSAANTTVSYASIEIKKADVNVGNTGIKVTGLRYPVTLPQGGAFSVMGTVTSPIAIDSVTVGVVNGSGSWVTSSSATCGEKTFDIYELDSKIRFGGINAGTYAYRVIIRAGGRDYVAGNYTFRIVKLNGPAAIAAKAVALAWPEGTSESTYKSSATNAEKAAAKQANMSSAADCGNFATIVIRTALGNNSIPNFLNKALGTKGDLSEMQAIARPYGFSAYAWDGNMSSLRAGDVLVYKKNGDTSSGAGQHIFIYLGNNKVAEANHPKHYYGNIDTKSPGKGVLSLNDRKFYYVLRCVL